MRENALWSQALAGVSPGDLIGDSIEAGEWRRYAFDPGPDARVAMPPPSEAASLNSQRNSPK